MANVPAAFKIIIQRFSGKTFLKSKREIYNCFYNCFNAKNVNFWSFERALRYSKEFGLVDNPENSDWRIKSVDDMCKRLRNRNIENNDQPLTVSIAFEIIIQHFSDDTTVPQSTIEKRVLNAHTDQGGLPKYAVKDPVRWTLRFLNHFRLAEKPKHGYWRIKSVDDMCDRLHALIRNRNIGDEGEDF